MTKVRRGYRCGACGVVAARWSGRCAGCGEWNTIDDEPAALAGPAPTERAVPITDVPVDEWRPRPTGVEELDRVLGGGLVPGSVTLVGGEPGIGKSTLVAQALSAMADAGPCLLVSGEESRQQVRLRAERLGALAPGLWLLAETSLPAVLAAVDQVQPRCLAVDSIQTVHDPELEGLPGSVLQVRECAHRLVREAKRRSLATLLVGHVTKDGTLAGPRVLEHVVDTVLAFEGDRHHALRMLRAAKHRFGPTDELGLFEMADDGLWGVPDAGALFLADRRPGVPGSVVLPTLEGRRPLLVEVQALVAGLPPNSPLNPRRSVQGLDPGRLALVLAVLQRRAGRSLASFDVYASAVGGVRVTEPGADLAIALALASARAGTALPADLVACGEVGLGGELRQVPHTARRLAEAARLGFRRALVPASAPDPPPGVSVSRVSTLVEAVEAAGVGGG